MPSRKRPARSRSQVSDVDLAADQVVLLTTETTGKAEAIGIKTRGMLAESPGGRGLPRDMVGMIEEEMRVEEMAERGAKTGKTLSPTRKKAAKSFKSKPLSKRIGLLKMRGRQSTLTDAKKTEIEIERERLREIEIVNAKEIA